MFHNLCMIEVNSFNSQPNRFNKISNYYTAFDIISLETIRKQPLYNPNFKTDILKEFCEDVYKSTGQKAQQNDQHIGIAISKRVRATERTGALACCWTMAAALACCVAFGNS